MPEAKLEQDTNQVMANLEVDHHPLARPLSDHEGLSSSMNLVIQLGSKKRLSRVAVLPLGHC